MFNEMILLFYNQPQILGWLIFFLVLPILFLIIDYYFFKKKLEIKNNFIIQEKKSINELKKEKDLLISEIKEIKTNFNDYKQKLVLEKKEYIKEVELNLAENRNLIQQIRQNKEELLKLENILESLKEVPELEMKREENQKLICKENIILLTEHQQIILELEKNKKELIEIEEKLNQVRNEAKVYNKTFIPSMPLDFPPYKISYLGKYSGNQDLWRLTCGEFIIEGIQNDVKEIYKFLLLKLKEWKTSTNWYEHKLGLNQTFPPHKIQFTDINNRIIKLTCGEFEIDASLANFSNSPNKATQFLIQQFHNWLLNHKDNKK